MTTKVQHPWEAGIDPEFTGGNPTNFSFAIESLTVGDQSVKLPHSGVVAIVGGNNAGKSTLLRQIYEHLSWTSNNLQILNPPVLKEISLDRPSPVADLIAWLGMNSTFSMPPGQGGSFYRANAGSITPADAKTYWSGVFGYDHLGGLAPFLITHAHARDRFQWVQATGRRGSITDPPTHPLHVLEQRKDLLDELNQLVADIFGISLTLDRISGQLQLRVGMTTSPVPLIDAVTEQYTRELGELKPISEQGDGMQSVLGVLIPLVTSSHPVVLIDEPEAFLHPPQARILGRALAEISSKRGVQVILATHDRNMIIGLLESPSAEVTALRLTRDENQTSIKQLSADDITEVWKDPVLHYSNLLDGLFHKIVVLAENDRDCSFYSAALTHLQSTHEMSIKPHDILFTSTYGKHSMPRIASSLRDIGVQVVLTPDLDVLNDENLMSKLLESVGGDWMSISPDYSKATAQFRIPKPKPRNRDIKTLITSILDKNPDSDYGKTEKMDITKVLHVDSPWKALKTYGDRAFTADVESATNLLSKLDDAGIVTVRLGELEKFHPGQSKGSDWLPSALSAGAHKSSAAMDHVIRIVESGGVTVSVRSQAE